MPDNGIQYKRGKDMVVWISWGFVLTRALLWILPFWLAWIAAVGFGLILAIAFSELKLRFLEESHVFGLLVGASLALYPLLFLH